MFDKLKQSEEALCALQSLDRFLDDMQAKRWPSRDHDLDGTYVDANIGHAARDAKFHQPGLKAAIQYLIDQHMAAEARAQLPSQGGEAVEVVARIIESPSAIFPAVELTQSGVGIWGTHDLMTVAQHQRILAASVGSAEPVAAQTRFRMPQKGAPCWAPWQPAAVSASNPAWCIDSQGFEVEYRLLYTHPADPGAVRKALSAENQRVVPPDPLLAPPHPLDAISVQAGLLRSALSENDSIERTLAQRELRALLAGEEGVKP